MFCFWLLFEKLLILLSYSHQSQNFWESEFWHTWRWILLRRKYQVIVGMQISNPPSKGNCKNKIECVKLNACLYWTNKIQNLIEHKVYFLKTYPKVTKIHLIPDSNCHFCWAQSWSHMFYWFCHIITQVL